MPNEFNNTNYSKFKSIEDYGKTLEGSKYYHDLYLKAVNHPIRREILEIIRRSTRISGSHLYEELKRKKILEDPSILMYNIDFLIKALCIERIQEEKEYYYQITQAGKVIDYLK
jgi:hypothetical protein